MLSLTAQKAIDAYGGTELWDNVKFIEAEVSVRGLAFTLKRRPFFKHAKLRMENRQTILKQESKLGRPRKYPPITD